jgi:Legionella pneumophila major outer membrane protein precursor
MLRKSRIFATGVLLAGLAAQPALGQNYSSPNGNLPIQPGAAGMNLPMPTLVNGQGTPLPAAPSSSTGCQFCNHPDASHCDCHEDNNGCLLMGNPCLDSPAWAPPGWYFALEADVVGTHIKNALTNQITIGGAAATVQLPTAPLDWTASPKIQMGYRFGEGAGEFLLSYKFLITSGTETLTDAGGGLDNLHSRLDINAWDIDYASREYSLWPCWDMKWFAGVRMAAIFFDSTQTSPVVDQHASDFYFGAGPHFGLDLRRFIRGTGVELIGRVETAFLIGEGDQSFGETISPAGAPPASGFSHISDPLVVPYLSVQAGVGWVPPGFDQITFSAGYTLEIWWDMADIGNSRGDITSQGVFLRAEYRY